MNRPRKAKSCSTENEKLLADMEKYRQIAVDMGADAVKIVPASEMVQGIRVRMGENFPRGQSMQTCYFRRIVEEIPWKAAKQILASYRYCLVANIVRPLENRNTFAGPASGPGQLINVVNWYGKYWPKEDVEYWTKEYEKRGGFIAIKSGTISRRIVAEARKDGHRFAFSGTSGACTRLCREAGFGSVCVALSTGICRMPGKSGPLGTAQILGMDHPGIYAKLGWKNWVQGWSVLPEDFPDGPIDPPPAATMTIFID